MLCTLSQIYDYLFSLYMIQVQIEVGPGFSNLMMLQDTQCYKVLDVVSDFTNDQIAKRVKSIRSLIFYYIFHGKPHFLKSLFQSRFLFDFTNKNRIKCSFTL